MPEISKNKEVGAICPECKIGRLVIKTGRYGNFTACSNFPNCKYIVKEERAKPVDTGEICDSCNVGHMLIRDGKFGKFKACSNYPRCKNTKKITADRKSPA